jgi:hypothetical protein
MIEPLPPCSRARKRRREGLTRARVLAILDMSVRLCCGHGGRDAIFAREAADDRRGDHADPD